MNWVLGCMSSDSGPRRDPYKHERWKSIPWGSGGSASFLFTTIISGSLDNTVKT